MKTDEWITGDKLYSTVFRKYSYFELYNDKETCIHNGWINLSARGRKAAQATKNKVTRDSKGRFTKIPKGNAGGKIKFTNLPFVLFLLKNRSIRKIDKE